MICWRNFKIYNVIHQKRSQDISDRLQEDIYIEKTKRFETRVKEDFRNIKNGEIGKLAVAALTWEEKHAMHRKPLLLKQASNKQLTNWENILITKNKDRIINFEILPADH